MKKQEYEIVLKAKVDCCFGSKDKDGKSNDLDKLPGLLSCIMNNELLLELQAVIDVPVKEVNVYKISEGCIEITFGVVFLISCKESMSELAMITARVARSLIERRLKDTFMVTVCVNDSVLVQCKTDNAEECIHYKRAFFCFLLSLHVVLLVCAGILVFKAVSKVCW